MSAQAGSDASAATLQSRLRALKAATEDRSSRTAPAELRGSAEKLAQAFLAQGDPRGAGFAHGYAAALAVRTGDFAKGRSTAETARRECRRAADLECDGRALVPLGIAAAARGDNESALRDFQAAAAIFSKTNLPDLAAKALLNAANIQDTSGDRDGAVATNRRLAAEFSDPTVQYAAAWNEAGLELDRANYANARAAARRALDVAVRNSGRIPLADPVCSATVMMGLAATHLGDRTLVGGMLGCARAAVGRGRTLEASEQASSVADALNTLGRSREALPWLRIALDGKEGRTANGTADLYRLAARIYTDIGEFRPALAMAQRAYQTMSDNSEATRKSAIVAAIARSGVAEREAALELTRTRAALERERSARELQRTRTIAGAVLAVLLLLAALAYGRLRIAQVKRRQAAVVAERERVARDIHDTIMQGFTGVALQLQTAAASEGDQETRTWLASLARTAAGSVAAARNAVWQMRSPEIDAGALVAAIENWVGTQGGPTHIRTDFADLPPRLGPATTEALLRIVQESVTNALRHGRADHVWIEGRVARTGALTLTIRDDGVGFDADVSGRSEGRWGLLGMRERIERIGGRFTIASVLGAGTTVTADVPREATAR